jgi:hypothetical protein
VKPPGQGVKNGANTMKKFNVSLHGKEIDSVFYKDSDPITSDEVKQSLVGHDGYDPAIEVELEPTTLADFITKHGLRFECHRVDSRPDGLMTEVKDGRPYADNMRHFRCRIIAGPLHRATAHSKNDPPEKIGPRSFGLYFSQGSAHTSDPTLADVLDCLASDASGYEDARYTRESHLNAPSFDAWASEYGYDTDSRKAEKTFRAIKRQAEQLKRTLGQEAYEELLYNTERL